MPNNNGNRGNGPRNGGRIPPPPPARRGGSRTPVTPRPAAAANPAPQPSARPAANRAAAPTAAPAAARQVVASAQQPTSATAQNAVPKRSRKGKIARTAIGLSLAGLFAVMAGYFASGFFGNGAKGPSTEKREVLKGPAADRIVRNFSIREKHLARVAPLIDEHLCYRLIERGPNPKFEKCQTLKDLEALSARFGERGIEAFKRLDLYIDAQYLPDVRGNGGILNSVPDGKVSTLFTRDSFWGNSIDLIVRTMNEYLGTMRSIDSRRFDAEVAQLPRIRDLLKDLPGTASNPICWNVDVNGQQWTARGCKPL